MAQESNNNKKSQRNFNLEKGTKRSFNLEKESPFKEMQPELPAPGDETGAVPPMEFPEPPETGKPMKMTWIWVCSVIVLIVIVIACIRGCDSAEREAAQQPEEPQTEQVTEPDAEVGEEAAAADAAAPDDAAAADQVADEASADAPQAADEAASAPETTPAATTAQTSTATASAATAPSSAPSDDIDAEAAKVIRGDYGNGAQRRASLGSSYSAVQSRVNQLMAR